MRRIVLAAALLVASGALAQDAFVPRPITDAEKEAIRQAVRKKLNDPDSAMFRWNPDVLHGATYCGFVNSRNKFGGYAGFVPFQALFGKDRSVFSVEIADDDRPMSIVTRTMCHDNGYSIRSDDPAAIDD